MNRGTWVGQPLTYLCSYNQAGQFMQGRALICAGAPKTKGSWCPVNGLTLVKSGYSLGADVILLTAKILKLAI